MADLDLADVACRMLSDLVCREVLETPRLARTYVAWDTSDVLRYPTAEEAREYLVESRDAEEA